MTLHLQDEVRITRPTGNIFLTNINRVHTDVEYDFVYMDEESFEKYKPTSFGQLMEGFREYKGEI